MITISKEMALELLLERLEYWTKEKRTINDWREYLENSFLETFEGELNPSYIIDNLWVNDIEFIDAEIVDNHNLKIGEEIRVNNLCGTLEYIGDDFIVIFCR